MSGIQRKAHKAIALAMACCLLLLVPVSGALAVGKVTNVNIGPSTNITYNFIDVKNSYWAADAIYEMYSSGVISGYPDKTFRPENPVTREEFAKILVAAFSLDTTVPVQPTFWDVPGSRWSFPHVEAAKQYLTGYYPPNGRPLFRPEENAEREDIAVALVKALGYDKTQLSDPNILDNTFTDVSSISPNLRYFVAVAVEKGLIKGYEDSTFRG